MKPLIVHGAVNLSEANRVALMNHRRIELETTDRRELALGRAVVINSRRFIVAARWPSDDVRPGKRTILKLAVDPNNRHRRRAAR